MININFLAWIRLPGVCALAYNSAKCFDWGGQYNVSLLTSEQTLAIAYTLFLDHANVDLLVYFQNLFRCWQLGVFCFVSLACVEIFDYYSCDYCYLADDCVFQSMTQNGSMRSSRSTISVAERLERLDRLLVCYVCELVLSVSFLSQNVSSCYRQQRFLIFVLFILRICVKGDIVLCVNSFRVCWLAVSTFCFEFIATRLQKLPGQRKFWCNLFVRRCREGLGWPDWFRSRYGVSYVCTPLDSLRQILQGFVARRHLKLPRAVIPLQRNLRVCGSVDRCYQSALLTVGRRSWECWSLIGVLASSLHLDKMLWQSATLD